MLRRKQDKGGNMDSKDHSGVIEPGIFGNGISFVDRVKILINNTEYLIILLASSILAGLALGILLQLILS